MDKGLKFISDLSWGYRASYVLQIANKLGVFTLLAGKAMVTEELAEKCGAKPDMLEKLLIACAALGLLAKEADKYRNTELSDAYLVKGKELYQGDIISHSAMVGNFWHSMADEILVKPVEKTEDEQHRDFILGMYNITMAGRGELFVDSIDLKGRKQMFDVGGGPGTYSILACREYPELKAIVFDLPETIAIAREIVAREGMNDRISFVKGSWETDDFGNGNDVVLFSNVLHGPVSQAVMKLKKAYDSLESGGLVVIQEFLLNDAKTGPMMPALFNLMVGAYSKVELLAEVNNAGFTDAKTVAEDEELGASWVTAVKP